MKTLVPRLRILVALVLVAVGCSPLEPVTPVPDGAGVAGQRVVAQSPHTCAGLSGAVAREPWLVTGAHPEANGWAGAVRTTTLSELCDGTAPTLIRAAGLGANSAVRYRDLLIIDGSAPGEDAASQLWAFPASEPSADHSLLFEGEWGQYAPRVHPDGRLSYMMMTGADDPVSIRVEWAPGEWETILADDLDFNVVQDWHGADQLLIHHWNSQDGTQELRAHHRDGTSEVVLPLPTQRRPFGFVTRSATGSDPMTIVFTPLNGGGTVYDAAFNPLADLPSGVVPLTHLVDDTFLVCVNDCKTLATHTVGAPDVAEVATLDFAIYTVERDNLMKPVKADPA